MDTLHTVHNTKSDENDASATKGSAAQRSRGHLLLLIILCSTLAEGCLFIHPDLLSGHTIVRVELGLGSPWEAVCETPVWHVLRWHDENGERKELFVPAGMRSCEIPIRKGMVVAVTATPLGALLPIGAVYVPGGSAEAPVMVDPVLHLTAQGAPAAELIQSVARLIPEQVAEVNGEELTAVMVEKGSGDSWSVETGDGWWDLISGQIDAESISPKQRFSLVFEGLPVGTWVSENPMRPDIVIQSSGRITLNGFYEGEFRYLHRASGTILTIYALRPNDSTGAGEAVWRLMAIPLDLSGLP